MTRNSGLHPVWEDLTAGLPPAGIITLVGGGGKTSLMYYLASGLKAAGTTVFAATTTKLFAPEGDGHRAVLVRSLAECRQAVAEWGGFSGTVTLAREVVAGTASKLAGLEPEWLDTVAGENPAARFVVEGDGSAGLPLKGHLAYEPVVPSATKLLIPVVGVDAIGRPLSGECVHRPARAAELAGAAEGEAITVEMIVKLLLHPEGYLHNCPPGAGVVPFVNKAEGWGKSLAAELAAAVLAAGHPAVDGVVVGSMRRSAFAFAGR
jgi:probable selenium-dependent hydroxylase accessory protein YqeC